MLAGNQLFRNSHFIDLMLQVTDANGRQLLTSLHTQTLMETTSIVEMCFAGQVVSDIRDVVSIDIFLGLVGQDELFNVSPVQNLDVAHQAEPVDMRRTASSTESNIMTIMFKGDPELFEQEYARRLCIGSRGCNYFAFSRRGQNVAGKNSDCGWKRLSDCPAVLH